MSKPERPTVGEESEMLYKEYALGVRIVEYTASETGGQRYRFTAPEHEGVEFDDPELATLYADIYFDVNGFIEVGTGERGVPPEVIQAGRDTLAAYFLTQPYADIHWVASFYGKKRARIERYIATVRRRAQEIRDGVEELDDEQLEETLVTESA
ncbi:hypothetical protein C440_12299 [Haloferax mucosum ATCC BAA-1512]|uniref:Uncharacterized protein n=1 Tax=Haloferax mucosum ATCC BAA-1512 TaxID=662479 RepID=M0IBT2_9EURY|nr:hypothetical protein [Haloferax mucosum]ELZ92899.1 hypothetical protein C440_12299 [Haloferax mucosum ATCC BAA-1512]